MPYSLFETKPWIMEKLLAINPQTILDVGPGEGIYSDLIKEKFGDKVSITAIEVWNPYIIEYELHKKYSTIIESDVRFVDNFSYDVVILGDVLEHMSKTDALELWEKVKRQAKYAVISIPIVYMPQGAYGGNPYEVHVKDDWTADEVLSSFSNVVDHAQFQYTGAFLAKF